MKRSSFADMPTPDLVREFTEVAREEGVAALWFDTKRYNILFKIQRSIVSELKRRGERDRLASLFDHHDAWVRYQAASCLMSVTPSEARHVLQALRDTQDQPVAGHAGMDLCAYDKGWAVETVEKE
jgi:hypothetical protein